MNRILLRRRAIAEARELGAFWGPRFNTEYAAALALLLNTPRLGPPCPRPRYPTRGAAQAAGRRGAASMARRTVSGSLFSP